MGALTSFNRSDVLSREKPVTDEFFQDFDKMLDSYMPQQHSLTDSVQGGIAGFLQQLSSNSAGGVGSGQGSIKVATGPIVDGPQFELMWTELQEASSDLGRCVKVADRIQSMIGGLPAISDDLMVVVQAMLGAQQSAEQVRGECSFVLLFKKTQAGDVFTLEAGQDLCKRVKKVQTDRQTDKQTDRQTDKLLIRGSRCSHGLVPSSLCLQAQDPHHSPGAHGLHYWHDTGDLNSGV